MLKKYDEALSNLRKGSQSPDSSRGCNRKVRKGKKRKPKIEDIDPDKEGVLEYHKMLVFSENLPSKDTQFNYKKDLEKKRKKKVAEDVPDTKPPAPVEEPKPEPVPAVEEPVQETTPEDGEKDMTESYAQDKFRDGVRRIDIVLVAVDDGEFLVTEERNRYLTNVLKAGLEIETSPGVYFRDDHLRFVNPSLTNYARLLPCTRVTHERELISLVRPEYDFDCQVKPRSKLTGLLQNYVHGAEKEVRTFLIVVLWIVLFTVPIIMVVYLFLYKQYTDINLIKDKVISLQNEEIALVVIFAIKLVFVQILGELRTSINCGYTHNFAAVTALHIAGLSLAWTRLIYNTMTDYNQGARVTKNVPSWEREYRLEPIRGAHVCAVSAASTTAGHGSWRVDANPPGFGMYTRYMNDTKYGMVVMWDSFNAYKKKNFVPKQCYYPSWFEDFYYLEYGDRPRIYMPPKDIRATHDSYVYRFEANILYLVFLNNEGCSNKGTRSHSAQGLASNCTSSPAMKIPLPPRLWITDVSDDESSDEESCVMKDEGVFSVDRTRVRSRFRHHKQRSNLNVPLGIFWDIENCQVPRGCSAIDVVAAIRAKFLTGRREADFVVVCDVRKESPQRLQELNDAQVSLIHVCGTQKNAADEKLRQCMRRFGELHSAPASLLLISGDINFAADLSDFRHRKNMEVILVHKQNTSSALITCASSHYSYNDLTAHLPRNPKTLSQTEDEEAPICEIEVVNLPVDQTPDRVSRRLRRLADNCGGKVLRVMASTAMLRFPTPDHAARALKRMDGEDVFGLKISTRYSRGLPPSFHAYSSDEGYSTGSLPSASEPSLPFLPPPVIQTAAEGAQPRPPSVAPEWALALQQLPAPTPPPLDFCPPPAPRPRRIRGMHGSANLDRSGCSSSNSGDDSRHRDNSQSRAVSPWNSSASFSDQNSECDDTTAELTVTNLPPFDPAVIQNMLTKLFSQYVPVIKVLVWVYNDGPIATVVLRSEWDARLAIARVHKRRLDNQWTGRRLELALGRPSPAPNQEVLRARLRAILLDQTNHALPLLRLRDAYASRHCCALTTSDIARLKDTVIIHEGYGRLVQLTDLTPVTELDMEEAPWKCHIHGGLSTGHEDGSRILQPVFMEISVLAKNTLALLDSHGGKLPLLSFVECYEAQFSAFAYDARRGVPLELLLHAAAGVELRDSPSRHLVRPDAPAPPSESSRSSERERPRTAPALEPMLALFERELIDLLRAAPRCCIPFSKLIPAFHHHFGRQCRVADYGFTKLPELLSALSSTIVVLGSGSYRIITISAAAQGRRWTVDLLKLLKAVPGRAVRPTDIPTLYQETFGKAFSPADYGVCTLGELMQRVTPGTVVVSPDGTVALPRRTPTPEEKGRSVQFAVQAVELLCYTPNLRMEFSRFVPAYHAHFGSQLRVAHYGCVKLVDLLEVIPDAVTVYTEASGERGVRLAYRTARAVMAQRLKALGPVTIETLPSAYAAQFGAIPQPDVLNTSTLEELVYATGGCIESGFVRAPGEAPQWVISCLAACAVLSADRSVARGSTEEYFSCAFRKIRNCDPDLRNLMAAGVVTCANRRLQLTPAWRLVWRVAQILADKAEPMLAMAVFVEYTNRFEPMFPCADLGFESVVEFLRHYREVFLEAGARWALGPGVAVPRCRDLPPREDYSLHDTPPGQKGSRVFESPKTSIWCSPPASALPAPTALLVQESKRRIRLAAQFDALQ
ncbi:hypothetical protein MSG28_004087 [Choristoneura fumiferana]|uniref:Uncharacterized protein n=1 Tax=Choristoneura fumiferana TaxID=7141 RepID=A0ACC0KI67_CHOFU|nr:hypothetical protein MSG28_004087 [Choristoneura fumiferana]